MGETHRPSGPLCPSARPEAPGAVVFGVVGGTVERPRVGYLDQTVPVSENLLALTAPVPPSEVLRMAGTCIGGACAHFADRKCRLAAKVVRFLPVVVDELPPCAIRPDCRWFRQEGGEACRRCPQVVRDDVLPSTEIRMAADPGVRP